MSKNLRPQQEVFLRKLCKIYGYTVKDTYKAIAVKIGNLKYSSVRNHLRALEEAKVLKIENKGKYNQAYYLDRTKVKKLLNE
jgi:DNA-binding transcriptional ArsR family regulator